MEGKRAVSGSGDMTARVWDLEGQTRPRVPKGHIGEVRGVAISANGKHAVSGSYDGTVRVWDLEGRTPPRVLEDHIDSDRLVVAISADGKRAIFGSRNLLKFA